MVFCQKYFIIFVLFIDIFKIFFENVQFDILLDFYLVVRYASVVS